VTPMGPESAFDVAHTLLSPKNSRAKMTADQLCGRSLEPGLTVLFSIQVCPAQKFWNGQVVGPRRGGGRCRAARWFANAPQLGLRAFAAFGKREMVILSMSAFSGQRLGCTYVRVFRT